MPLTCSPPALVTRPATADDIPLLRDLAERIWRVAYAEIIPPEQIDFMLGWMYSPEQIARELSEGGAWELALVDGQPAGFFSISFADSPRAKLQRLYLLPERQGTGLGQALLNRVHALAATREATEVFLQVNKQNARAIRAYQRSGYVVTRAATFDIGHGYVMDDFIMQRDLSPQAGG
jgi:GNAT superfamily N-acetyltransferase